MILFINCKDKQVNKGKLLKDDFTYSEKTIRNDTIDLSTTSKTIELAAKFFDSKIYSVNDTIYFNGIILNPFYGSSKDKSSYESYYNTINNHDYISSVGVAQDKKIVKLNLKLCIEPNSILDENLIADLTYLTEKKLIVDGGEIKIFKFYCSQFIVIILEFNKPNHIASIHPKCNYNKKEIPIFIDMISIYDINDFYKQNSTLSYNSPDKSEILSKIDSLCN